MSRLHAEGEVAKADAMRFDFMKLMPREILNQSAECAETGMLREEACVGRQRRALHRSRDSQERLKLTGVIYCSYVVSTKAEDYSMSEDLRKGVLERIEFCTW